MNPEGRFWKMVSKGKPDDCWLWRGSKQRGYGRFDIEGKHVRANRYSWEIANGPLPSGVIVCHTCDNPACVNPAHLYAGTNADNMRDKMERGRWKGGCPKGRSRSPVGSASMHAKLTESQVSEIRARFADGEQQKVLAREFGVTKGTMNALVHGRTWKHVPIPKTNPKRRKRLFEEDFGGPEYLAFIRSLPCDVCGVRGFTVAAHLTSRGAGGKAKDVAPLCCSRFNFVRWEAIRGCHEKYDDHDPAIRKHEPRLRGLAKQRWASHREGNAV